MSPTTMTRPLHVFCLLPTLNPYGGVISVVNAINQMILAGHRVTLGSLGRHKGDLVGPYTEPIHVKDATRLASIVPDDIDVFLATSWHTVEPLASLAATRPGSVTWYFVQDFEPDFYDDHRVEAALQTYDVIPNRVVKTRFLQSRLEEHGWSAHLINPGMNLDIFYPRDVPKDPNRVLAMARPPKTGRVDNRGFGTLVELFEELKRRRPATVFATFGEDAELPEALAVDQHGRRSSQELPDLYSSASVFVDTSLTHGFGRTGVEALACGCALVTTASGGVSEYAIDEENALVCPVGDVAALADACCRLLDEEELNSRLTAQGRATVESFDDGIAAAKLLSLFEASLDPER